jgi:uncharacterized protein (TIGR02246 family)
MATHQQRSTLDDTTIEDFDAIAATVQLYIDGSAKGDAAKLAEAFHPDAHMYGAVGGQRFDEPITEYFKLVEKTPAGETFRARITSITQTGDAAAAIVAEENFWDTLSFVSFFSLCRTEGRWLIVNKTFAHTAGEPPASE